MPAGEDLDLKHLAWMVESPQEELLHAALDKIICSPAYCMVALTGCSLTAGEDLDLKHLGWMVENLQEELLKANAARLAADAALSQLQEEANALQVSTLRALSTVSSCTAADGGPGQNKRSRQSLCARQPMQPSASCRRRPMPCR